DDCINTGKPNSLNCRQTIANRALQRRKAEVTFVNVRWQQSNPLPAHFLRVAKNFRSVFNLVRKNRSVKVFGIMRLQVCGLESKIGIRHAMRFWKTVVCKLTHQRKNLLRLIALHSASN